MYWMDLFIFFLSKNFHLLITARINTKISYLLFKCKQIASIVLSHIAHLIIKMLLSTGFSKTIRNICLYLFFFSILSVFLVEINNQTRLTSSFKAMSFIISRLIDLVCKIHVNLSILLIKN